MPSSGKDFSSASEDADELVADLLQQFSAVNNGASRSSIRNAQPSRRETLTRSVKFTSPSPSVSATRITPVAHSSSAPKRPQEIVVEVPPLPSDAEDYEFLPGHSTVWRIWDKKRSGRSLVYWVELASLDKEWVSYMLNLNRGYT